MGAPETFDLIVLGAGSGGISCATTAAELGARVLVIEKDKLGGTCVNRGCVPKKLMWDVAWHHVRAEASLVAPAPPVPDFAKLHERLEHKIEAIHKSYDQSLDEAGVTRAFGAAQLESPGEVRVGDAVYRAEHIVIAVGARPVALDISGAEHLETSDDVFRWTKVPERIAFLGGGYIGCELASIFAAMGAEVVLADSGARLLDQFAAPLRAAAQEILAERGLDLRLNAKAARVEKAGQGLEITFDDDSTARADRVVACVGRVPNVDRLGPLADRLETAESGALTVDERFRTNLPGIYAIGDAADRLPLTPVATRDGDVLAKQLFGDTSAQPIDLATVATAAFVMPPIAQVGEVEGDGEAGHDLASDAIYAEDHWTTRTFREIETAEGQLKGAALMAEAAADMIGPFAALLAMGKGQEGITAATAVHPTFGEEVIGR